MKMGTLFIIVMGVAIAAAFAVVVINRQSSEMVNAAVPLTFGALSALGLVFAFTRQEPIDALFPVAFYLQREDMLPLVIPDRPFPMDTLALASQAQQIDPKVLDEPDGSTFGSVPYHDFLQKVIIDRIASRHFGTWRMKSERFESGFGEAERFSPTQDAASYKSLILKDEDIQQIFGPNRFSRVHTGFGNLALPPHTILTIQRPQGNLPRGEIRLKNWFVEIRIMTEQSWGSVGLGPYALLLGLSPDETQKQYCTANYVVRAHATFTKYLIGHPQMAAHREWAEGIIKGLSQAFDEEAIWRRAVDNYMLRKHLPASTKELSVRLGTIHVEAPKASARR